MGSDLDTGICGRRHVDIKLVSHSAVRFTERSQQEKGRKGAAHVLLQVCLNPQQIQTVLQAQFLLWNLRLTGGKICLYALMGRLWSRWQIGDSWTSPPRGKASLGRSSRSSEAGEVSGRASVGCPSACSDSQRVQEPEPPQPPPLFSGG